MKMTLFNRRTCWVNLEGVWGRDLISVSEDPRPNVRPDDRFHWTAAGRHAVVEPVPGCAPTTYQAIRGDVFTVGGSATTFEEARAELAKHVEAGIMERTPRQGWSWGDETGAVLQQLDDRSVGEDTAVYSWVVEVRRAYYLVDPCVAMRGWVIGDREKAIDDMRRATDLAVAQRDSFFGKPVLNDRGQAVL